MVGRQSFAIRTSLSTIDSVDSRLAMGYIDPRYQDKSDHTYLDTTANEGYGYCKNTFEEHSEHLRQVSNKTDFSSTDTLKNDENVKKRPFWPHQQSDTPSIKKAKEWRDLPDTQTEYMEMLVESDNISWWHNLLVAICTWTILASFLILPATFTSIRNTDAFKAAEDSQNKSDAVAHAIASSIANLGLLVFSAICCSLGTLGCLAFWWRWRNNYIWLTRCIFLPALVNAVAGLLTTIVSVYAAQDGVWSVTARSTAIITSSLLGVAGCIFAYYKFVLLGRVRQQHIRLQHEGKVRRNATIVGGMA